MINRKEFLKVAGCTALAGLTGRWAAASPGSAKKPSSKAGRKWAMVVDLGKCRKKEGCKECTLACHAEHNVPEMPDPKDVIKWIWKESFEHAFHGQGHDQPQKGLEHLPTPVFCNHCENPACVKVCPVQATWKRESDGLVMMDWHRCIGCRYCVVACPYGSRSFNWRDPRPHIKKIRQDFPTRTRGVVEKCSFCDQRLAYGKLPACVEACPAKALMFGDLQDPKSEVSRVLGKNFSLTRKPALGTNPKVYYLLP